MFQPAARQCSFEPAWGNPVAHWRVKTRWDPSIVVIMDT